MTEERLTTLFLKYLSTQGWEILSYDFPQSGTGITFKSNQIEYLNHKNKGTINPDIIAIKEGTCLFFENKDRFYKPDFIKQNNLIKYDYYKESIYNFLQNYEVEHIYYGIGLPDTAQLNKAKENECLIDFLIIVSSSNLTIEFLYNPYNINLTS